MDVPVGDPFESMALIRDTDEDWHQSIFLENIEFKFDQSWMAKDEMWYIDMKYEPSARGYWAFLVQGVLEHRAASSKSLWIIDKDTKWFEESIKDNETVYRDCEGEYVEVGWDSIPESTGDGVSLSASAFLSRFISKSERELRETFAGYNSDFRYAGYESDQEAYDFKLEDRFRLLVRRENQVQEVTWKCWDSVSARMKRATGGTRWVVTSRHLHCLHGYSPTTCSPLIQQFWSYKSRRWVTDVDAGCCSHFN